MEREELNNLRKEVAKLKKKVKVLLIKINNKDDEHIVLTEVIINLYRKMRMMSRIRKNLTNF